MRSWEDDRAKVASMQGQLESGKAFEKELFNARKHIAAKDVRLAELENQISRLMTKVPSSSPSSYAQYDHERNVNQQQRQQQYTHHSSAHRDVELHSNPPAAYPIAAEPRTHAVHHKGGQEYSDYTLQYRGGGDSYGYRGYAGADADFQGSSRVMHNLLQVRYDCLCISSWACGQDLQFSTTGTCRFVSLVLIPNRQSR